MDHLQILDSLLKKDYDRRATPTNHLSKLRKQSQPKTKFYYTPGNLRVTTRK